MSYPVFEKDGAAGLDLGIEGEVRRLRLLTPCTSGTGALARRPWGLPNRRGTVGRMVKPDRIKTRAV
jgi:hypothetical protein